MGYIYQITNKINNKIYIGKTEFSVEKRFKEHCKDAFRERNEKRPLYNAMKKYGIENFIVEILEEVNDGKMLEEREIYWIEQKDSYRNGYNATLGGEGRRYIDYDLVIETYKELGVIREVADKLNISTDTVSHILHQYNIPIPLAAEVVKQKYGKPVDMFSLEGTLIRSFLSVYEAARYMVENKLTNCKITTIKQHITEVCTGRRKTVAKYKWAYGNNANNNQ